MRKCVTKCLLLLAHPGSNGAERKMIVESDVVVTLNGKSQATASYALFDSSISALRLVQYKRPTPTLNRVA